MSDNKNSNTSQPPHTAKHDVLGLTLIGIGALLGTSAVMYIKTGPTQDAAAFAALMSDSVESFGAPAILWMCFGFLFVGARLYLFGGERGLLRDALGFVTTGFGLSIVMGAINEVHGGAVGGAIGGVVHPAFGVILGGLWILGTAWFFWLRAGSSGPSVIGSQASALISGGTGGPGAHGGPGGGTGAPESARSAPRSAPKAKAPSEDPSGVTTAEADALLPDDDERARLIAALRNANRNNASTVNRAPSPYPPDVRREGGIPEGARPIDPKHDQQRIEPAFDAAADELPPQPATPSVADAAAGRDAGGGEARSAERGAGSVHVWNAPKHQTGKIGAGGDLARDAAAGGAVGAAPAPRAELSAPSAAPSLPRPALEKTRAVPIIAPAGSPTTPTWEREPIAEAAPEIVAETAAADLEPSTEADPHVAAPEAVEAEVRDAERVDAYGTPLELVAELRGQAPKVSGAPVTVNEAAVVAQSATEAVESEAALADEDAELGQRLELQDAEESELDEDDALEAELAESESAQDESDEDEDAEEADEQADEVVAEDADEDDLEDDLEDEDADEEAQAEFGAAIADEESEDEASEHEVAEQADEEAAEAIAELDEDASPAEEPAEEEPAEQELAEAAESEDEDEPAAAPHAEREVVLQPTQPGLFDAPAPARASAAPAAKEPAPAKAETPAPAKAPASSKAPAKPQEPAKPHESVPVPAPSPSAAAGTKSRGKAAARESEPEPQVVLDPAPPAGRASASEEDLVFQCGLLFLKHQRVAVSMLQREFGLDFKQATAVLDELQAQGLIGPYLGGQRRDILLTAEEWRARVGAST